MARLSWFPKLLTSRKAKRYASLQLVVSDLMSASICCSAYLKKPAFSMDPESLALLDFALIRYRRCFNEGQRSQINNLVSRLSPDQQKLHRRLKALGDLHIAHSINGCEQGFANFHVAIDGEGNCIGAGSTGLAMAPSGYSRRK